MHFHTSDPFTLCDTSDHFNIICFQQIPVNDVEAEAGATGLEAAEGGATGMETEGGATSMETEPEVLYYSYLQLSDLISVIQQHD